MKTIATISAISPRLCRGSARGKIAIVRSANLHNTPAKPWANKTHAFSFAEVMFAVVILGIGFIMVAAIFPVAIQQTQATGEESSAAAIARETSNDIASVPGTVVNPIFSSAAAANTPSSVQNLLVFPPTVKNYVLGTGVVNVVAPPAIVVPFVGTRWNLLKGNMILPSDPRYAYVPFYRRESGASSAQLIVISVSNRTRPIYTPTPDLANDPLTQTKYPNVTTTPANFAGAAASPHTQVLIDTVNVTNYFPQEGFYLTTPGPTLPLVLVPPPPPANRTYRLGRQLTGTAYGLGIFEIAAGDALELTAGTKGWGTSGGIVDTALAGSAVSLNATTTLQATVAYAAIAADPNSIGGRMHIVLFPPGPTSSFTPFTTTATIPPNVAQGAFVIVADDFPYDATSAATMSSQTGYVQPDNIPAPVAPAPPFYVGALNGRIFRLGKPLTTNDSGGAFPPGVFDLDPQYGMRPGSGAVYSPDTVPSPALRALAAASAPLVKVYIVGMGRNYTNVSAAGQPIIGTIGGPNYVQYSNSAQDVGVFTTYFPVK